MSNHSLEDNPASRAKRDLPPRHVVLEDAFVEIVLAKSNDPIARAAVGRRVSAAVPVLVSFEELERLLLVAAPFFVFSPDPDEREAALRFVASVTKKSRPVAEIKEELLS